MVDDLNDCIEGMDGHAQAYTPHLARFAKTAASCQHAYTNAPMCGPSRASLFTGIYPHQSHNFYQAPWYNNEILANSPTIMEHFKDAGYYVAGTGKILHHLKTENWTHFENPADYTPTPFDGSERLPHPDVPAPFTDLGWVDGSLGPFINLDGRKSSTGKDLHWTTGNPAQGFKPMKYVDDDDRDPTPDEINALWAAKHIRTLAEGNNQQPFFLAVGFLRPHTPLVAPQKYFDRFPLEDLELAEIKSDDQKDTYLSVAYKEDDVHALRFGKEMYEKISQAYGSRELGLKKWTQAYLACVAAVDDNIGTVLDALEQSIFRENTIVIIASDHGFHMGEKNYLYKNSLWEESTRVPLLIRAPDVTKPGSQVQAAVSLIDIFPTLVDLCGLPSVVPKTEKGLRPAGQSMRKILRSPKRKKWSGSGAVLTAVYAGEDTASDPALQHYSLRSHRYRYILYNTGHEEIYDHKNDPFEWHNLLPASGKSEKILRKMRLSMREMLTPINPKGFDQLKVNADL